MMMYPNTQMSLSKTLVWISGDTKPVKDQLKADGFRWSPKKQAWWMKIADYTSKTAGKIDPAADDYALMGTAADGTPVVVAECHHITLEA